MRVDLGFKILGIAVGSVIVGWFLQDLLLQYTIPNDKTREDWIEIYLTAMLILLAFSLLISLVWYVYGRWLLSVRSVMESNQRNLWVIFFFIILVASGGVAYYISIYTQEGKVWVYSVFAYLGVSSFYLETLFGSPASLKYNVPLAVYVRR